MSYFFVTHYSEYSGGHGRMKWRNFDTISRNEGNFLPRLLFNLLNFTAMAILREWEKSISNQDFSTHSFTLEILSWTLAD